MDRVLVERAIAGDRTAFNEFAALSGRAALRRRDARMVAVDATWGGETHGLYAAISAANDAVFAELAPSATEMIEGARLPQGVGQGG